MSPPELRELSPGRYVVAAIDEVPALTDEEEEGIRLALDQVERGESIPASEVYSRLDALIASKARPRRRPR